MNKVFIVEDDAVIAGQWRHILQHGRCRYSVPAILKK